MLNRTTYRPCSLGVPCFRWTRDQELTITQPSIGTTSPPYLRVPSIHTDYELNIVVIHDDDGGKINSLAQLKTGFGCSQGLPRNELGRPHAPASPPLGQHVCSAYRHPRHVNNINVYTFSCQLSRSSDDQSRLFTAS